MPITNEHQRLLSHWPSAYALSKHTGVPLTTAKRWKRNGVIADPSWWVPLIEASRMAVSCYALARDYKREKAQ